ncbi:nitrilase-related carbon-nitrogen hydrolase [Gallaecimonas xiamenensis]|nr:nitrilase-related carbon-nitrogen hydrolase [Gallaecimonas xiamenensis]
MLSLSACQYRVEALPELASWTAKQAALVAAAPGELLLFPEYASLELLSLQPTRTARHLARSLGALQEVRELFVETYRALSKAFNKGIVMPSIPWQLADGRYVNRAWFAAEGTVQGFVDKQILTRFEAERWQLSPGQPSAPLVFAGQAFGVQICYDVEFPLLTRALVDAGARFILVPSCTDNGAGVNRVRIGCQARALENQTLVVQSPLVGQAPWAPAIFNSLGQAAFYTAPDLGLPDDGILARSKELDPAQSQWLTQALDLDHLEAVRHNGQVLNHRDWAKQRP